MLTKEELALLTTDERKRWDAANLTEKMYMANELKNVAKQRAIERGAALNGVSAADLKRTPDAPVYAATVAEAQTQLSDGTRYGAARAVIGLMDVVAWLVIGLGLILLFVVIGQFASPSGPWEEYGGFESRPSLLSFVLPVGVMVAGLVIFANGQLLRATLDTADATRLMLAEMRKPASR